MNKEETFALYSQGKEAWNAWAKEMLERRGDSQAWGAARVDFRSHTFQEADFSGFIFPGGARFDKATFEGTAHFQKVRFPDSAIFLEATFKGAAWFEGATFESDAMFWGVTFRGAVEFQGATFEGAAEFGEVRFENEAMFEQATFKGTAGGAAAEFWEVRFEGSAVFEETIFEGAAVFDLSTFENSTSFYGATFRADANFKAVQGNSIFTMADAEFMEVPDFQQATFVQAPRLDNVKVGPQLSRWDYLKAFFTKGDLEKEGRWRALKRLATQGHDHASEQLFFREELLARRGVTDRYWHASFWLGVFYQILSDFGRSLIRPLLWWAIGVLVFAGIYLSRYPGGGKWFLLECIEGTGKPWVAALGLSLHRSLPALSGFSDTLPQFHACLYGVQSENPFRPIIPDVVSFLGVPQVLFSAVMIFLFLLAVRNHFRIK